MSCEQCNSSMRQCNECEYMTCPKCNKTTILRGCLFCVDCSRLLCYKCKHMKNKCWICNIIHCKECDNGSYICDGYDDGDIFKCIKCRDITLTELYKYIVDTYDEKLTLNEIKNKILNLD